MKTFDSLLRTIGLGPRRPRERRRLVRSEGETEEQALRVLFAVESLDSSRVTRALLTLLESLDRRHFVPVVAAMSESGALAEPLRRLEVAVRPLGADFEAAREPEFDLLCTWGLAPRCERLATLDPPWLHVACESLACLEKKTLGATFGPLREADAWIATSPVTAECARRRLGVPRTRIQLLPAGVSSPAPRTAGARAEARTALAIQEQARIFLSVGDFQPSTGHRLAIEALARLSSSEPRPELICAGDLVDPRYLESCRKAAESRGLPVRFVTLEPQAGIQQLCAAADFFVQPLGIDGLRPETLSALASGLPVLAADTVDARELLGEKPFALLFHDLADWTKAGPKACARLESDPASMSSPLFGAMRAALRSAAELSEAAAAGSDLVAANCESDAVARCFEGCVYALARPIS